MMTSNERQAFLDTAMQLPAEDRAILAEQLWASLDAEHRAQVDAAILAECEPRADAIDAGRIQLLDGKPIIDKLQHGQRP